MKTPYAEATELSRDMRLDLSNSEVQSLASLSGRDPSLFSRLRRMSRDEVLRELESSGVVLRRASRFDGPPRKKKW